MAKVSNEAKEAKRNDEKRITAIFKEMPVSEYVSYIENNVSAEDKEQYKKCARRALNLRNIADYLIEKGISKKDKDALIDSGKKIKYEKIGKEYKKDKNGNNIPMTNEDGEPIVINSVLAIIQAFIKKYMPELKPNKKESSKPELSLEDFMNGQW